MKLGFFRLRYILIFLIFLFSVATIQAQTHFFGKVIIDPADNAYWIKTVGDIDNDGNNDIIVGGELHWYKYPNWTMTLVRGWYASTDGEVADLDGDGDLDMIVGGAFWFENPLPTGNPESGSSWIRHTVSAVRLHDISVADLDGDGKLDIIGRDQGATGNVIYIYKQISPDSWTQKTITSPTGEGLYVGDVDRDNDLDLITGNYWYENTGSITTGAWSGFAFAPNFPEDATIGETPGTSGYGLADINRDGYPDIVLSRSEGVGKLSWFQGKANPKLVPWTEHIVESSLDYAHGIALADFNGDGLVDIATGEMVQSTRDRVLVYLNFQNGMSWNTLQLSNLGTHNITTGDIDNDGDYDLVGSNWRDISPLELWRNHSISPIPTATPTSLQTGDANGDGRVDGRDYFIWLARYGQNVSGSNNGDFNNDGRANGIDYVIWLRTYTG